MWKYCFLVQKNCNSSNDNDNSNSNKTINSEQIQYSFSQLFKSIKNIKKSCPSSWPASTWSGLPNQGVKLSKSNSGRRDPSRLRLSICFQVNHRNPVALSITCTNFAPKGPKCCSRFVKLLLQPRFPLNLKWCLWGFCWLQKLVVKTTPFNRILTVYTMLLSWTHEELFQTQLDQRAKVGRPVPMALVRSNMPRFPLLSTVSSLWLLKIGALETRDGSMGACPCCQVSLVEGE